MTAPCSFALDLPALYKEASSPWSSEQAVRLPSVLTPEVLEAIAKNYGEAAGKELAVKKEKVSALVRRFRTCDLNGEDLKTSETLLNKEFKTEVVYFAVYGCKAVKEYRPGAAAAGPARTASFGGLEALSASPGSGDSYSRFFDGSRSGGRPYEAVAAGPSVSGTVHETPQPPKRTPLASIVPSLNSDPQLSEPVPARMPDINTTGLVHQAVNYWDEVRERNWGAVERGDLKGAQKAKAAAAAAAAFGFSALLVIANLPKVEETSARLRYDISSGAQRKVIAADSAKLAFHVGVSALTLLPIPMVSVAKAALAGSPWAIALLASMTVGPINRYVVHFAD